MLSFKECQMRHKFGYIYSFTNLINGKRYIGLTTNPELRKSRHIEYSKDINCQAPLYRAIRKYARSGIILNDRYLIIESVSTDGDECSHVGLEISTNSKRNAR